MHVMQIAKMRDDDVKEFVEALPSEDTIEEWMEPYKQGLHDTELLTMSVRRRGDARHVDRRG